YFGFFFSSRRRHTRLQGDWSSDVCSSDLRPLIHPSARCQWGTAAGHKTGARLGLRLCGAGVLLGLLGCRIGLRAENWPAWRGPRGDGTSSETHVPIYWSATSNVVWKTEVPGNGHASPIVWDDRVFTVTALLDSQDRVLLCLDRKAGRILWQKTVIRSPLEKKHSLNSYASSTPATDVEQVYVAFLYRQEMVVAAYDLEGNQKWLVRPGLFSSMHGFCSSPI